MPKSFINESDAKYQKKLNFLDVFARLAMEKQLLPANLKTKYNGKVFHTACTSQHCKRKLGIGRADCVGSTSL